MRGYNQVDFDFFRPGQMLQKSLGINNPAAPEIPTMSGFIFSPVLSLSFRRLPSTAHR